MIGMCIVDLDSNVTFKKDVVGEGLPIMAICGNKQPVRNYATSWVWEKDGHDKEEVRIYISKSLDSDAVLKKLSPIFESVGSVSELIGTTHELHKLVV